MAVKQAIEGIDVTFLRALPMKVFVYTAFNMETLEREAPMSDWSDDKLDHLDRRVDEGFERMDQQFTKVDKQFERIDARFERIDQQLADTPTREEMNHGFGELRKGNGELRQGIEQTQMMIIGLNRTLLAGAIAIIVALVGFHG